MRAFLALAVVFSLACVAPATAQDAPRRPNVVLFLVDDLGVECLESYGGTSYRTPHIDALARTGMRFTNAWATPMCTPSRVELLTGRYGFRTGWTRLIERGGADAPEFFDPRAERTFAHVLRSAGYATAVAGKWQLCDFEEHPRHAVECGFDEYCCWTWKIDGKRMPRHWSPAIWQGRKLRPGTAGRYGEDVFSDFVVDFMTRHEEGPFLVYYPLVLVHAPFGPTPLTRPSTESGAAPADPLTSSGDPRHFADMVAYMDQTVGKVVSAIDALGLREDTVILFSADNGTDARITSQLGGESVRGGKGTVSALGARVPLIASWKGTCPAGLVVDDLVDFSDVLPTLAELAGAPLPEGVTLDGRSFAPQLRGEPGNPREWVFTQLGERRLVYDGRFLLHDDGRLYDAQGDPFEKRDLAGSDEPAAREARERLRAVLTGLR